MTLIVQLLKFIAPIFRLYPLATGQWRIDKLLFKNLKGYKITKDSFTNSYLVDLENCIDRMIYVFGSFEKNSIRELIIIANSIKPDVFFDIGANIGVYTISLRKSTKIPTIHAFEPDNDNYLKIKTNLLINKMDSNVILHKEALSDKDGHAKLILARDNEYLNMGKSRLASDDNTDNHAYKVETCRLDSIFNITNNRILIKIDIEGHEKYALAGMIDTLQNNKVFLQVEIFPENYEKISNLLSGCGYSLANTQPPSLHDFYFTNITGLRVE